MATVQQAKKMIFQLGLKHGVSPRIISERLLSKEDKEDILEDKVPYECLDASVQAWKECGMPHLNNGL